MSNIENNRKLMNEQMAKFKTQLNESITSGLEKELDNLINNIQSGNGVDKRAIEKNSDGELLAQFILPIFQSALMRLNDRNGFSKKIKGKL